MTNMVYRNYKVVRVRDECSKIPASNSIQRTELFWVTTQQVRVISYDVSG